MFINHSTAVTFITDKIRPLLLFSMDCLSKKRRKLNPFEDDETYLNNLRIKEKDFHKSLMVHKDIYKYVRDSNWSLIIDWMIEICEEADFLQDTLFLSFHIILHYLSRAGYEEKNIQLNASNAISLASKVREISGNHRSLKEFVCKGLFTQEELSKNEYRLCNIIEWKIEMPTEIDFLLEYGKHCTEDERFFAMFIIEKTFHNNFLVKRMLPSFKVACALFLTSIYYDNFEVWTIDLQQKLSYSKKEIFQYSQYMNNYLLNEQDKRDKGNIEEKCVPNVCFQKYSKQINLIRFKNLTFCV